MKALLICPDDAPEAAFFTRLAPQALCPLLGRTALDRALAALCSRGAKDVTVLSTDRPAEVRAAVGDGKRWGLRRVEVRPMSHEPSVEEARALCVGEGWLPQPYDVTRVSGWPEALDEANCQAPAAWFANLFEHLDEAGAQAVGMRQIEPGIWVGTHARIAPDAKLLAPCWIGQHAVIGAGAILGPRAVVESKALVDEGSEISDSLVGPATYTGAFIELRHSLAWGDCLLDWKTGSLTEVPDAFLLADLHRKVRREHGHLLARCAALAILILTWPTVLLAWWRVRRSGDPLFLERRAVRAPLRGVPASTHLETVPWYSLNGVSSMFRRWPELWNVMRGDFTWVGNRPLTPAQAEELRSDFELLWLASPPGLLSLADAEGADAFDDEARAHAAFYTASMSWRGDLAILWRCLKRLFQRRKAPPSSPDPSPTSTRSLPASLA